MSSVASTRILEPLANWLPAMEQCAATRPLLMPQLMPGWNCTYESLPGYHYQVIGLLSGDELIGYLPFVRVDGPYGNVIHSTAYLGYGGPVARDEVAATELLRALVRLAEDTKCVTVTIGTPPFMEGEPTDMWIKAFQPDHVTENFYQYCMLVKHPLLELTSKRRGAFRNEIKKAAASGMKLNYQASEHEFETWIDIYYERYEVIGARPYPRDFFRAIFKSFVPTGRALFVSASLDGAIIGGTLFLLGHRVADYFSTAYKTEFMDLCPATLVLNEVFDRLMADGYTHFNWESSPGRGGVFRYKERWGALEGRHYYLTRIVGDMTSALAQPARSVADAYRGCFVAPFSIWDQVQT